MRVGPDSKTTVGSETVQKVMRGWVQQSFGHKTEQGVKEASEPGPLLLHCLPWPLLALSLAVRYSRLHAPLLCLGKFNLCPLQVRRVGSTARASRQRQRRANWERTRSGRCGVDACLLRRTVRLHTDVQRQTEDTPHSPPLSASMHAEIRGATLRGRDTWPLSPAQAHTTSLQQDHKQSDTVLA